MAATSPTSPGAATYSHLSLWWDTLPEEMRKADRPPLTTDTDADVVIVGAGYTGLWTAYYLLQHAPDLRVRILEAEVAGFGASGRNGGWCSALFPASWAKVARTASPGSTASPDRAASPERAVELQRALFDCVDEVGRVLAREGIDAHFAKGGTIGLIRSGAQQQRADEEIAEARLFGFGDADYALWDADRTGEMVRATNVEGATFTPHCAAIHPARLVRGLANTVERMGAVIHEHSPVLAIEPGRAVVTAPDGRRVSVRAPHVIRATEGYTARLAGARRDLAPVYSLMLATEPLSSAMWERIGLASRATFNDYRHLIIYGQRTADDRIAFGGRGAPYHFGSNISARFDRDPKVFDELQRVLVDLFPEVESAQITHRWGGPLGVPRDWFASVRLDPMTGIGTAGGYVGDGVGASNLGGRTLADLILGRDTERTHLPWVGHRSPRWEPEPLRWLGVNAGLAVMGSADPVEERTGRPARRASIFGRFTGH